MRPEGCEADLLRILASMPFLDRQEMVAVSGWSRAAGLRGRREAGGRRVLRLRAPLRRPVPPSAEVPPHRRRPEQAGRRRGQAP